MEDVRSFILDTFNNRYTCKEYDPDRRVSDDDFKLIMEAARLSPSSMGFEPWKFILLNNKDIKDKIYQQAWGAQKALEGASHFVLILARKDEDMKHDSRYIDYIMRDVQKFDDVMIKQRKDKYKSFREDDFKLNESERTIFDWTCKQTYIALANMLTTAAMLGIDSTPIEGFHKEKTEAILIKEGIYDPKHFGLSCMIAFGYTNRNHRPKTRRKIEEIFEVVE